MINEYSIIDDEIIDNITNKKCTKYVQNGRFFVYLPRERKTIPYAKIKWLLLNNIECIPKHYDIHHIDLNKSNDDINNLICIPKKIHTQIHSLHNSKLVLRYNEESYKIYKQLQNVKDDGFSIGQVSDSCNGKREDYKGYKWCYV